MSVPTQMSVLLFHFPCNFSNVEINSRLSSSHQLCNPFLYMVVFFSIEVLSFLGYQKEIAVLSDTQKTQLHGHFHALCMLTPVTFRQCGTNSFRLIVVTKIQIKVFVMSTHKIVFYFLCESCLPSCEP